MSNSQRKPPKRKPGAGSIGHFFGLSAGIGGIQVNTVRTQPNEPGRKAAQ